MTITATEFKANFGKYLGMISNEDIFITKNGKTIAKVVNPHISSVDLISGILSEKAPKDLDKKSLRGNRLEKYALND